MRKREGGREKIKLEKWIEREEDRGRVNKIVELLISRLPL